MASEWIAPLSQERARIETFLQTLWPHGFEGRWLLLWGAPSKRSEWVSAITDETSAMIDAWAQRENVYLGCALREQAFGPSARGTRTDCTAIPGLWLDVDYGSEHKKPRLPATEAEARRLIDAMGLPPTMVVHSGRGLQVWWCFKEPWVLESEAERTKAEQLTQGVVHHAAGACEGERLGSRSGGRSAARDAAAGHVEPQGGAGSNEVAGP